MNFDRTTSRPRGYPIQPEFKQSFRAPRKKGGGFRAQSKKTEPSVIIVKEPCQTFVESNYPAFLQVGVQQERVLKKFADLISQYSFSKKVGAFINMISFLDCGGKSSLSKEFYTNFGSFFVSKILTPACDELAGLDPKQGAQELVSIFLSIRTLICFRKGILLSNQKDDYQGSLGNLLVTFAKTKFLPEILDELLVISKREDSLGNFLNKLFTQGRLAGSLVIGTDPHPALDMAAYAFLFLDEEDGLNWLIKLKTEEQSSYSKAFILPVEYPRLLIESLREKIERFESIVPVFEEVVREYAKKIDDQEKEIKNRRDQQSEKIRQLSNFLLPKIRPLEPAKEVESDEQSFKQYLLSLDIPYIFPFHLPQPIQAQDQILNLNPLEINFDEKKPLPNTEGIILDRISRADPKTLASLSIQGMKYILRQIEQGNRRNWPNCLLALKILISHFPEKAADHIIPIVLTLSNSQWNVELKSFVQEFFSFFKEDLWSKIIPSEKGEIKSNLYLCIALLTIFDIKDEGEREIASSLRNEILVHLANSQVEVFTLEEGKLILKVCELIFKNLQAFPLTENLQICFVKVAAYSCSSKTKNKTNQILELSSNLQNNITLYNLKYLQGKGISDDSHQIAEQFLMLMKICSKKKFSKIEKQIIVAILSEIQSKFYHLFKFKTDELVLTCQNFKICLKAINNLELNKLFEIKKLWLPWLLLFNFFGITNKKLNQTMSFNQLVVYYPKLFEKIRYLLQNDNPIRQDVCEISRTFFDLLLEGIARREDGEYLKDLLLFAHAFNLFSFDLRKIFDALLNEKDSIHLHAALQIACGFISIKEGETQFINLEMLSSLTSAYLEAGTLNPSINWCRDIVKLSNLIHENYYVGKTKSERRQTKEVLGEIALKLFSLAKFYHLDELNFHARAILRLGAGVAASAHLAFLPDLHFYSEQEFNETGSNESKGELFLIRGRILYFYSMRGRGSKEKLLPFLNQHHLKVFDLLASDFEKIFQKGTFKKKKGSSVNDMNSAIALTECFGFYLANCALKKQAKHQIDIECWKRFCSIPAIQLQLSEPEERQNAFFKIAFDQASLSFATAFLNLKEEIESFHYGLEVLKTTVRPSLNSSNLPLALRLHFMLARSLCEPYMRTLDLEKRKVLFSELFSQDVIKLFTREDCMKSLVYIFEKITNEEEQSIAKELTFAIWKTIAPNFTPRYLKILVDHWIHAAKRFQSRKLINSINQLLIDF